MFENSIFCTFKMLHVQSQIFENLSSILSEEVGGQQCKKNQSFWNIVSSTKSCLLVFFSFLSHCNSNLYCNIPIVKQAWLWRRIIFKFEIFCVHQWCWYTRRSACSNRCDKWHVVIKMPDKIGCRCHPIIIFLYTPLLYWGCLLYRIKRIAFFFCKEQF